MKNNIKIEVYSWWFSSRDPPRFFAIQETNIDDGFKDSINIVKNQIIEKVIK